MKAAIIGAGFISDFHADAYASLPEVQLCGVCDIQKTAADRLAARYHCRSYQDVDTMLREEKPDLVSVCVPTFLHEPCVLAALAGGANVLCEKPVSLTLESIERMREAARKHGRMLMTAQVLRWWPEYVTIKEQMLRLGTPLMVTAQRLRHAGNYSWLNDPEKGGGVLFDLLIHDLDFLCSALGYEPEIDTVNGTRGEKGAYQRVFAMLHWQNGSYAALESANSMPEGFPFTVSFCADYSDSSIRYHFQAPKNIEKDAVTEASLELYDRGQHHRLACFADAQIKAFNSEIAAFVQGVQSGVNPLPMEDTYRVMKLIHQMKTRLDGEKR